jgi:flagellar biosynthesis/type III secretory pathway protein FliH
MSQASSSRHGVRSRSPAREPDAAREPAGTRIRNSDAMLAAILQLQEEMAEGAEEDAEEGEEEGEESEEEQTSPATARFSPHPPGYAPRIVEVNNVTMTCLHLIAECDASIESMRLELLNNMSASNNELATTMSKKLNTMSDALFVLRRKLRLFGAMAA